MGSQNQNTQESRLTIPNYKKQKKTKLHANLSLRKIKQGIFVKLKETTNVMSNFVYYRTFHIKDLIFYTILSTFQPSFRKHIPCLVNHNIHKIANQTNPYFPSLTFLFLQN